MICYNKLNTSSYSDKINYTEMDSSNSGKGEEKEGVKTQEIKIRKNQKYLKFARCD